MAVTSSTTSKSATSPLTPSPPVIKSSSGLGIGAKAEIGAGAILGAAVIISLSVLLYLSNRQRKKAQARVAIAHEQKLDDKLHPAQEGPKPQELSQDSYREIEVPAQNWDSELDPSRIFHELPSQRQQYSS
ncbi:MAG: hypothetical protein L6R41_002504 [Letrouitia leprolyta]|nr:MAG: hypothetical protein L6R41_002504 [Letrouitia leprolyta]